MRFLPTFSEEEVAADAPQHPKFYSKWYKEALLGRDDREAYHTSNADDMLPKHKR